METINELISKSKHLTDLLIELNKSIESEKYQYIIKHEYTDSNASYYSLLDRKTNKVKIDKFERIISWLEIRNIDKNTIWLK